MRNKFIFHTLLCVLSAFVQMSCEDAKNESIDNLVYFSEAFSSKIKNVSLEQEGTDISLSIRLAKVVDTDITATISIDEEYLDNYNKANETSYTLLDKSLFSYSGSATIKAGSINSTPIDIKVDAFDGEGGPYAIPLSITSVDGGVNQAESSSKIIIVLSSPLVQFVPKLTHYNHMRALPLTEWRLELSNYTLEWWSRVTAANGKGGYTSNNQAIFNSGGNDASGQNIEFYVRFGDTNYGEGLEANYNFLQVKTFGSQFDSGNPAVAGLEAGEWYHFAITYNALTGTTLMYKNGEKVAVLSTMSGKNMWIDKFEIITSSKQYFKDYCEMCQVRFWKTVRTARQIKNNMYNEVDPANEDLILYLPMNEGEGTTLHDVTGNGHDVEIGNMSSDSKAQDVTWESYTFAQ